MSSDENESRLRLMAKTCNHPLKYIALVNSAGGVSEIDDTHEHAICDCINRLGDSIKLQPLGFDGGLQKSWSAMRIITAHLYHRLELSKVWESLPGETQTLLGVVNEKLMEVNQSQGE